MKRQEGNLRWIIIRRPRAETGENGGSVSKNIRFFGHWEIKKGYFWILVEKS